ncbi:carboxypeptidase regulatory-like domain-containing protein [Acidicapsa dinghuensis]|uniref:Carboxypeptidase regulatory-like domain-containing protein n=1 Tax=Acidicapsa dinghuensis TaxID=2218256 RepID=A0ABW1EB79_9BACT|nr:TonB-dependent receptor [Acidicapsa dinghuensis]
MPRSRFRTRHLTCALLAILAATSSFAAHPPETTGSLDGKLTDTHSAPLQQATVTLRNLVTGKIARAITGKNGSYRFTSLNPGEYALEANVPSLGKGSIDGILISAGHATRMQAALIMTLPPLPTGTPRIDPTESIVSTTLPAEDLQSLPVPTRNWQSFAAITPTAQPASAAGSPDTAPLGETTAANPEPLRQPLSLSGASAYQTGSTIDGIASPPSFRTASGQGHEVDPIGTSAVESMELHASATGTDIRKGDSTGSGDLGLTTHRGSTQLHGQAFYLNRQNLWGAQNPFTQQIVQTAPAAGAQIAQFTPEPYTPPYTRQTFGAGAGGHIRRDKLFWFAAIDGLLNHNPALATVRHADDFFAQPTNDDLQVLSARLNLPQPAILEEAASTYSTWLGNMTNLLGPVPRSTTQIQGFGRIDWQATERQHIAIEANAAASNAPGSALSRTSETYGSHSFGNAQATDTFAIARADSFLTENLLNSLDLLYRRDIQSETPQSPSAFEAPLLANSLGQLPEIVADSKYGFILGQPSRIHRGSDPDEHSLSAQDTLSWVRGKHLIKIGLSADHIADIVNALDNQNGTYSYTDILNFISDAAGFEQYGYNGVGNPFGAQHNCDATGRVHVASASGVSTLEGLGYLPCYAWYSQRIGPANWSISTNDLAAFINDQWQLARKLTISAGLRVETQQLPPPISSVSNSDLPMTEKLPSIGLNFGPRLGIAWSPWNKTVIHLGAGLYYGRINSSVLLAALTQTGSLNGDLDFFFRPTDTGAPPFPYVFSETPQTVVKPGAVSFAGNFHVQQVDQAVFGIEQSLPSHWTVSVSALASLGRRLPVSIDTNIDPSQAPQTITYGIVDSLQAGPIKSQQLTVPFYAARLNPNYQQLASIESRANSTYDAALIKLVRTGGRGLTFRAHYLYAHATDWNPNESGQVAVNDVLDPQDFRQEYGTSNLDIRHSAAATFEFRPTWRFQHLFGEAANGWSLASIGQYRSGLPFTMRTGGYIPAFYGAEGQLIQGIGPGINGSGGDRRLYGIGRNSYRYPQTWTADARVGKRFYVGNEREIELVAQSFNLFNHQNITLLETTGYTILRGDSSGSLPTLNFLTGLTSQGLPSQIPEFGKPLDVNATDFYHPREIELGLRTRF